MLAGLIVLTVITGTILQYKHTCVTLIVGGVCICRELAGLVETMEEVFDPLEVTELGLSMSCRLFLKVVSGIE